jgi:hypothetical protein
VGATEGTGVGLVVGGGTVGLFVGRKDGLGVGLIEGRVVVGSVPVGAGEGVVVGSSGSKSSRLLGRLGSKSDADEVAVVGPVLNAMGNAAATIAKSVRTYKKKAHFNVNARRVCSVSSSS